MKEKLEALAARLDAAAEKEREDAKSFQPSSWTHYTLLGRAEGMEAAAAMIRELLAEGKP